MPVAKPLDFQRFKLPFTAVHLQCLDDTGVAMPGVVASGFVVRESDGAFLYTSWHVVTGIAPHDVRVPREPPKMRSLRATLQGVEERQPGFHVVGGSQTATLSLYDEHGSPTWLQDEQDKPNIFLNAIRVKVPFWHDAVKFRLPDTLLMSELQLINSSDVSKNGLSIGERVYVVGYPYGYSVFGPEQPTPIVLTRFVASVHVPDRHADVLLDSSGAQGMSGGPVYVERGDAIVLAGIYTGVIFPDHVVGTNEKITALGTVCSLHMTWDHLKFVPYASR